MSIRTHPSRNYISQRPYLSYDNVWYIKPETPPVVFEDVYGNEITRWVKRELGSSLRNLTDRIPRVGDFSNGQPIRRQPIVLDQYGGYVVLENVSLSLKLNLFSQAPLHLSSWAVTIAIQADTRHIYPQSMGPIGKFLEHWGKPVSTS